MRAPTSCLLPFYLFPARSASAQLQIEGILVDESIVGRRVEPAHAVKMPAGNGVVAVPNSTNFNDANFGEIGSTRDAPYDSREIQFALKLYF